MEQKFKLPIDKTSYEELLRFAPELDLMIDHTMNHKGLIIDAGCNMYDEVDILKKLHGYEVIKVNLPGDQRSYDNLEGEGMLVLVSKSSKLIINSGKKGQIFPFIVLVDSAYYYADIGYGQVFFGVTTGQWTRPSFAVEKDKGIVVGWRDDILEYRNDYRSGNMCPVWVPTLSMWDKHRR